MSEMTYYQRYELIQKMISIYDYNRALFVTQNMDLNLRVRKNLFQFYNNDEIKECAHHILTNYNFPNYTFDKMSDVADDKFTARMLRASVPHWRRAVNAYVHAHMKQKQSRQK